MNIRKDLWLCVAAAGLLALAGCSSPKSSMQSAASQEVSSAASVTSSSSSTVSLSDTLKLGAKYLSSLNFEGAIIQFKVVLEKDPGNKNARAGLVTAHAASGNTEQAESELSEGEELYGNNFLPYVLDDVNAIGQSSDGKEIGAHIFEFLSNRYLNLLNGQTAEGENALDEENSIDGENSLKQVGNAWLALTPDDPDAYVPLSVFYQLRGDDEGLSELVQTVEENGLEQDAVNASIKEVAGEDYVITINAGERGEIEVPASPDAGSGDVVDDVVDGATSQAESNATSGFIDEHGIDPNSPMGRAVSDAISDTFNFTFGD